MSRTTLSLPSLAATLLAAACTAGGENAPVGSGPARIDLVDEDEPGRPLVLSGRVFEEDGRTPLAGARLDLYQTDAEGYYTRPVSVAREARIRGSVWTDEAGRYEVRTILPGHYPAIAESRHVHVHLAAPGVPDHWVPSFLFAGDPELTAEDRAANAGLGRFSAIVALEEDDEGVLRGARDFRVDAALAERNRLVDGWYRGE